jgi:hypothetical protein
MGCRLRRLVSRANLLQEQNKLLTTDSKARDPDIRRIAREAEARLINDPQSGYRQWPSEPPPSAPTAFDNDQAPAPTDHDHAAQTPIVDLIDDLVPLSPTPEYEQPVRNSAPVSPQEAGVPTAQDAHYASPYGQPPTSSHPLQMPTSTVAPMHSTIAIDPNMYGNVAPRQAHVPQGPPLQPATPSTVILSRTRETKILLSVDGDGIRGLSALLLIESLVNAICVKIGQRLDPHQIFDLTGGSSLGGVIAILLCRLQMQAHRAREAYKKISRQVFLNKRDFFISLDPQAPLLGDGTALEDEIRDIIQQELGSHDQRLYDDRQDSGDV